MTHNGAPTLADIHEMLCSAGCGGARVDGQLHCRSCFLARLHDATSDRPFRCSRGCKRRFRQEADVAAHERDAHGERGRYGA